MRSKLVPLVRNPLLTLSSLILIAHCNVVWMQLLQFVDEKYNTQPDSCPSLPVQCTLVLLANQCRGGQVEKVSLDRGKQSRSVWTGRGKQAQYEDKTDLSELGQVSKLYILEEKNQE